MSKPHYDHQIKIKGITWINRYKTIETIPDLVSFDVMNEEQTKKLLHKAFQRDKEDLKLDF